MAVEHFRADCEPTSEPTPVENSYIRDAAPNAIDRTLVMGARNATAEHIAAAPDVMVEDGVVHADSDVVIIRATDAWGVVAQEYDLDPDALGAVKSAHNNEARDRCDDIEAVLTMDDVMVISRDLLSDDADVTLDVTESMRVTCSGCREHLPADAE